MTEPQVEYGPHSRTLGEIAKALAAFQAEAPTVGKSKTADVKSDRASYSYSYADLADITKAAYPKLGSHGLAFTALPDHGQIYGMLIHESGEYLSGNLPIPGSGMQALGSSITYARRYLFGCLTGIVTEEDDDGQAATQEARQHNNRGKGQQGRQQRPQQHQGTQANQEPPALVRARDAVLQAAHRVRPQLNPDQLNSWIAEQLRTRNLKSDVIGDLRELAEDLAKHDVWAEPAPAKEGGDQ